MCGYMHYEYMFFMISYPLINLMHAKEEKFRFAYIDAKKDYQPKFIEFGAFSLIASQFLT